MATLIAKKKCNPPRPPLRAGRTKGMLNVIRALQSSDKSLAWLAGELGYTRQGVSNWTDIPEEHVPEVSRLTGLPPKDIRPDRAKLYADY